MRAVFKSISIVIFGCLLSMTSLGQTGLDQRTVILFDRSASMLQSHQGARKIDLAKNLFQGMSEQFALDPNMSLRFFAGGTSSNKMIDCQSSKIGLGVGAARSAAGISSMIDNINAVGQQTPITYALERAQQDMEGWLGPRKIILISDGQETCQQDPESLAEAFSGAGITVDTIGIGPPGNFAQLGMIALAGAGEFHLAENLAALQEAMATATGGSSTGAALPIRVSDATRQPQPAARSKELPAALPDSATSIKVPLIALPPVAKMLLPEPQVTTNAPALAVEIIFDASGSMAARLQGQTKLSLARRALAAAVPGLENPSILVGMRAYGFDQSLNKTPDASCPNTELVLPFTANRQATAINRTADALSAYGYTPIANSLTLAGHDLLAIDAQKHMIILISDGEETCGGFPAAVAANLRSLGIDLQTHVIGFDLDATAQQQMQAIASAGGGQYFDAADGDELGASLMRVIDLAQEAADPWDMRHIRPVSGGPNLEQATELTPGNYTLDRHLPKGEQRFFKVTTKLAQRALLRGVIQSRKAIIGNNGANSESSVAHAGFEIRLFRPDGSEVKGHWARVYGARGEQAHTTYIDLSGEGFYFSVGNRYDTVNKDALFGLQIDEAGDLQVGQDAPKRVEQAPNLPLDRLVVGHLGLADRYDSYRSNIRAGATELQLKIRFTIADFRYQVDIRDANTNKRITRLTQQTGASDAIIPLNSATTAVSLQIKDNNPSLNAVFSSYTLKLNYPPE
jgi:Ca-activated chloride channel family protein